MALYEIGVVTTAPTSAFAYAQIHTGAPRVRIKEIHLVNTQAVMSQIGLVRASGVGTQSATSLGQPRDPAETASATSVETAWSVQPTGGALYLRRATLAAVIGNGVIWSFPDPLIMPASAGLLLWNFGVGAGGILNVNVIYDE
jgi:hypothetical protein